MSSNSTQSAIRYKSLNFMGFLGYRVGNDGVVWSERVQGSKTKTRSWKKLSPWIHKCGYPTYHLLNESGNKVFLAHRLVLLAFVGPCPEGMEGCHNDGNPANNHLSNLRWDTRKANIADAIKHGRHARGEKSGTAKLTCEDVMSIKRMYASGDYLLRELAVMFNVCLTSVHNVVRGKRWNYPPKE